MNDARPCVLCGCDAGSSSTHAIAAAVAENNIDRAIDAGLLDDAGCVHCSSACTDLRMAAREARITALAARDRFRQRTVRLDRRNAERAARRTKVSGAPPGSTGPTASTATGLPPAAAAALARAKARVAGRDKP